MSSTFPVVRKGYDPAAVDAFVKEQAAAWHDQLEEAVTALEEWRRRAEALAERSAELEQRLRQLERNHGDRVAELEAQLGNLTWERDRLQAELADISGAQAAASADASAILREADARAAQIIASAEEEAQRWFATARRRIEMAEAHAGLCASDT